MVRSAVLVHDVGDPFDDGPGAALARLGTPGASAVRLAGLGLPVAPTFVVTSAAAALLRSDGWTPELHAAFHRGLGALVDRTPLGGPVLLGVSASPERLAHEVTVQGAPGPAALDGLRSSVVELLGDPRCGVDAVVVRALPVDDVGTAPTFGVARSRDLRSGARPAPDDGDPVAAELHAALGRLEVAERRPVAVAFAVAAGRLYLLEHRWLRLQGVAAVRAAVAFAADPAVAWTPEEAVRAVRPVDVETTLHPKLDGATRTVARGVGVSPGAAVGVVCRSAEEVLAAAEREEAPLLVVTETTPADATAMQVAVGVLTTRGGRTSHAALVARGLGIPAVVGVDELICTGDEIVLGGRTLPVGARLAIDGGTGEVALDDGSVGVVDDAAPDELATLLGWADRIRAGRFAVQANADTADDVRRALTNGADGIGLCRTEHQLAAAHAPVVRAVLVADDPAEEESAIASFVAAQRSEIADVLDAAGGHRVVVRVLDAPLGEFVEDATESNPMLGTRGARMALVRPALYRAQAQAIAAAVADRRFAGAVTGGVALLVPFVSTVAEFVAVRRDLEAGWRSGDPDGPPPSVGVMIETPRAALCAAGLAAVADFVGLGTNDLTQLTFGLSRDDLAVELTTRWRTDGLLDVDPFVSLDVDGVGRLVRVAVDDARSVRPTIEVTVCGELGGDPVSIDVFADLGIDRVSCSPFRVPVARLAAARAVLRRRRAVPS
jgi:pyruvate,orthophosphate dikinase